MREGNDEEKVRIWRYLQDRPLQAPGLPYTLPAGEPCFASAQWQYLGGSVVVVEQLQRLLTIAVLSTVRAGAVVQAADGSTLSLA